MPGNVKGEVTVGLIAHLDTSPAAPGEGVTPLFHEKYDGSGYHGAKGDAIPFEARIVALADVYDALTSDRPYRKALPPPEARDQIVKASGTQFDPLVDAFMKAFRKGEMEVPSVVV